MTTYDVVDKVTIPPFLVNNEYVIEFHCNTYYK